MNNIRVSVPLPDLIRAIIIALEHLGIEVSDPDANEGAQLAAARVANQPPESESNSDPIVLDGVDNADRAAKYDALRDEAVNRLHETLVNQGRLKKKKDPIVLNGADHAAKYNALRDEAVNRLHETLVSQGPLKNRSTKVVEQCNCLLQFGRNTEGVINHFGRCIHNIYN